jgi:hypothetical protein
LHYYDVANNVTNTGLGWLSDHLYFQSSVCIGGCISLTYQGGQGILSTSGPSFTRIFSKSFKGRLYAGDSFGITTATPQETLNDNAVGGGCLADGWGGCAGAIMNEHSNNVPSTFRPYVALAAGEGLQVEGALDKTWNLNVVVSRWVNDIF